MKNFRITVNGKAYDVAVDELNGDNQNAQAPVAAASSAPAPAAPKAASQNVSGTKVTAPMPGKIVSVKVNAGDAVKKGALLVTLEAMKMENEILAPVDGTVGTVAVDKGKNVETGDLLVSIN